MASRFWQLNDPDWLRREYLERRRTLADLAEEIGCHDSTMRRFLDRYGIRKHHVIDEEWLRREYLERGRSMTDIATELGCSKHTVARARDRFDIARRDRRGGPFPRLRDPDWLRRQLKAGRTHREIAEQLGCSRTAVTMALRRSAETSVPRQ